MLQILVFPKIYFTLKFNFRHLIFTPFWISKISTHSFSSISCFWKKTKMKIMSPDLCIISNNMHGAFLTNFLIKKRRTSLMLMQISQLFFSVNSTQTAAGNANKKHITSSAPDDIFQETPTQVVENSKRERRSWIDSLTHLLYWPAKYFFVWHHFEVLLCIIFRLEKLVL